MIMGLALVCSCVPDHRDSQMPDATVYFSDNTANKGVQQVLVYDVQSEGPCSPLSPATSATWT